MHASQPRRFDQHFDVLRDTVPDVVRAGDGLHGDLEHLVDAGLVDTDGSGEGSETCVGGVAGLVDDVDVEIFYLVIKQCLEDFILGPVCGKTGATHGGEGPELRGIDVLDCQCGLMGCGWFYVTAE